MNRAHCVLCGSLLMATLADPVYACRSGTCVAAPWPNVWFPGPKEAQRDA